MYERLVAHPASYRATPSTFAATCVAAVVLVGYAAALGLLVWLTLHATALGWVLVVLGWAGVVVARPRRFRLPADVFVLDAATYPALHDIVSTLALAVGVAVPQVLGVDLAFNAYVVPLGLVLDKDAMVLGLPMMSLGSWHERLGILGHELGHLRGRDTVRSRVISAAHEVLDGAYYLIAPQPGRRNRWAPGGVAYESYGAGPLDTVGRWIQGLLALPVQGVSLLLTRLTMTSHQHREYLADRRAAEVVGSEALARSLLWDLEGIRTVVAAAARRQEDPFGVLTSRPSMTESQAAARLITLERKRHRSDSTHPLDHLRSKLVKASALPPSTAMPGEAACLRAEAELEILRERFRREFRDRLIHGRRA
ncbi:MAG: hypothetical protein JWR52_87 [Marmoricola sp.]|nr:hypothetical protein [Marmoricola sp.]